MSASTQVRDDRYQRFDIAKGILMLLVVFGHSIQFVGFAGRNDFWADPVFKAIYMFHMPLFMAYSGYFSPQREIGISDFVARLRSLVYPLAVWAIITALLRTFVSHDIAAAPFIAWVSFTEHRWFLWAVFLSFMILWAGQRAGSLAFLIYTCVMSIMLFTPPIWNVLPLFAFVFPFFLAGRYSRAYGLSVATGRRTLLVFLVAAILAAICFQYWGVLTYIYNNDAQIVAHTGEVVLMFAGAAAASIAVVILLQKLSSHLEATAIGSFLAGIGRVTLETYIVQGMVFSTAGAFARRVPGAGSEDALTRWILSAAFCVILMGITMAFVAGTRRVPMLARGLWGR